MQITLQSGKIAGLHQISSNPQETIVKEDDNNYNIGEGNDVIYCTLTLPSKTGRFPFVLFIGGSGPTDRNMNQAGSLLTNSFARLAEDLASIGIASVRYDKRGVGKSRSAQKKTISHY